MVIIHELVTTRQSHQSFPVPYQVLDYLLYGLFSLMFCCDNCATPKCQTIPTNRREGPNLSSTVCLKKCRVLLRSVQEIMISDILFSVIWPNGNLQLHFQPLKAIPLRMYYQENKMSSWLANLSFLDRYPFQNHESTTSHEFLHFI